MPFVHLFIVKVKGLGSAPSHIVIPAVGEQNATDVQE
jgi:hypothetical protein